MKTWTFKKYEKTKLKENRENIEMWFSQCKNKQHYKELFAFLYNLDTNQLYDYEIKSLLGEIETCGLNAFIDQYYKYGYLGFTPNILIV